MNSNFRRSPQASAEKRESNNVGTIHTVDCEDIINDNTNAKILFDSNCEIFKQDIIDLIKTDGTYKVGTVYGFTFIESKDDTGVTQSGGDVTQNWWCTLGTASAYINATVTKNGDKYSCEATYYLCDFYDWSEEGNLGAGLVADAEMALLHKTGKAKEFEVTGEMKFVLNFTG